MCSPCVLQAVTRNKHDDTYFPNNIPISLFRNLHTEIDRISILRTLFSAVLFDVMTDTVKPQEYKPNTSFDVCLVEICKNMASYLLQQ